MYVEVKNKLEEYFNNIPGFCNYFNIYADIAKNFPNNSHFVEVGSFLGKSSIFMALMLKQLNKNIRFDCVDLWDIGDWSDPNHKEIIDSVGGDFYKAFCKNLIECGVEDIINPIRLSSLEASKLYKDNSLDFICIDGSHKYEDVLDDLNAWYPKVKNTGIIMCDDYNWKYVQSAINKFFHYKPQKITTINNQAIIYMNNKEENFEPKPW